jgi:hypothetical protein
MRRGPYIVSPKLINDTSYDISFNEILELQKNKEIKKALSEAGRFLIKQGKTRLKARLITRRSERTGLLLKAFSYRVKKKNAGVIVGFRKDNKHSSLSWLIDKGTDSRYTDSGSYRGSVRPTYFWSETRESDASTALGRVQEIIEREIERIKSRNNATSR